MKAPLADSPYRWTSAARSHAGLIREVNEDACLEEPDRGIWAVADGMGGHALGDFASRLTVAALKDVPADGDLDQRSAAARRQLQEVNARLCLEAELRGAPVIGSTAVVLLAGGWQCHYLWVGDSRLYLLRQGELKLLTRDHSRIEELIASGEIRPEEARRHPERNLITRAIGGADQLEIDDGRIPVCDGDVFLLCSDGLSNEVGEHDIGLALLSGNCRQAAEVLVDLALKHGGRDNISAVVVRAEDLAASDKTIVNPAFL